MGGDDGRPRVARSLIGRFALAGRSCSSRIGIAAHVLLGRIVPQQYRDFADFHAEFIVQSVIEAHLQVSDVQAPVRGARYDELAELVGEFVLLGDVFRIKLWRPDGTIVFSDEARLVGERLEGKRHEIRRVIADGRHSEVTALANAMRHTPAGEAIEVHVDVRDDHILLRIEDEGPGVPHSSTPSSSGSVRDPRCTPDRQGPAWACRSCSGAQLHGGRPWVQDRPGGGASFRVRIPRSSTLPVSPSGASSDEDEREARQLSTRTPRQNAT